jgi:hypothetical protein
VDDVDYLSGIEKSGFEIPPNWTEDIFAAALNPVSIIFFLILTTEKPLLKLKISRCWP